MAEYPSAIKTFTNPTSTDNLNSATVPHATQHAAANAEITAIETELGTNPKGSDSSVKDRLDRVDVSIVALGGGAIPLPIANGGTGQVTAAAAATALGLGTGDSPMFAAVNVGNASDTTITRVSAGVIAVEGSAVYTAGGTDIPITDGGTGSSTAAGAATNLGVGTGDSPQFTAVNVGHATDTTITRSSAGVIAVEGNVVYSAGGTDVPVTDGGTGSSTAAGAATNLGLGTGSSPEFTAVNVGHATDTTISRVSAGVIAVEGVTVPTISSSSTFTNKRNTKRVLALSANSATPSIDTDLYDVVHITSQTAAITSLTSGLSGTPVDGDTLRISITGTAAVAITHGASFEASAGCPLSTTTVTTARLDMGFLWNTETSKWRQVAQA